MPYPEIIKDIPDHGSDARHPVIAAILAHADDLESNVGGTFAKYMAHGYRGIYGVLSLCNSGYAPEDSGRMKYLPSNNEVKRRRKEMECAANVFGAELFQLDLRENIYTDSKGNIIPLNYSGEGNSMQEPAPEGGLPLGTAAGAGCGILGGNYPDPVDEVRKLLEDNRPEIVFAQCVDNNNPDHFAASLIVYKAYVQASKNVKLGPLYIAKRDNDFIPGGPDLIVDVSGHEEITEKAYECHFSQGYRVPKLREKWHRWGSKIGVRSAEAFRRIL